MFYQIATNVLPSLIVKWTFILNYKMKSGKPAIAKHM